MTGTPIDHTPSAYANPLLIKHIFRSAIILVSDQEIVHAAHRRFTYREFGERVHRLASALSDIGVQVGQTVAVMDWDTPRYLECFFAVPMMGAVLHTVNVRLSPEQILYTINNAEDDVILVNAEFTTVLEQIWDRVDPGKKLVLLNDTAHAPETHLTFEGEYEALLAAADPDYPFPELDENSRATTFYTTGTTGLPKGVYFSHRQLVLHTLAVRMAFARNRTRTFQHRRRVYAGDADVPRPRLGLSLYRDAGRREAGLPRPICPGCAGQPDRAGTGHLLALRADDPANGHGGREEARGSLRAGRS